MTDEPTQDPDSVHEQLLGWGAPEPAADFVDRVVFRTTTAPPASRPWARWLAPLFVGAFAGAAATLLVVREAVRRDPSAVSVMRVGAAAEVVAEGGADVQWDVRADGRIDLHMGRGVAWISVEMDGPSVTLHADGEEVLPPGACVRVSVLKTAVDDDVDVDDVPCADYERARARLQQ
ncbi:MAG: hypothetical protein ACRBN8_31835 [Nannocystales bacterium]